MTIEISTIIRFVLKLILVMAFIYLAAVVTPKIAKKIDQKSDAKHKQNHKKINANEDELDKADVFGASYKNKDENTGEKNGKK